MIDLEQSPRRVEKNFAVDSNRYKMSLVVQILSALVIELCWAFQNDITQLETSLL